MTDSKSLLAETVHARAFIQSAATAIRQSSGLSLADIATALDVSASTIWRWENGDRSPRPHHAREYAELLKEIAATR
jgi:transcriptional regulator with XRE-family HTH domain